MTKARLFVILFLPALFQVGSPAIDCRPDSAPTIDVRQVGIVHNGAAAIPLEVGYGEGVQGHGVELTNVDGEFQAPWRKAGWTIHNGTTRPVSAIVINVQNWFKNAEGKEVYQPGLITRDYWWSVIVRQLYGTSGMSLLLPGETRHEQPGGAFGSSTTTIKLRVVLAFLEFDDGERIGHELTLSGRRATTLSAFEKLVRAHDAGVPDADLFRSVSADPHQIERAKRGGSDQDILAFEMQVELDGLQSFGTGIPTIVATAREVIGDWRMRGVFEKRATLDHLGRTGACP